MTPAKKATTPKIDMDKPMGEPKVELPEVGTIVTYTTVGTESKRPAIVVAVNEDETVDLTIFNLAVGAVPLGCVPWSMTPHEGHASPINA